MSILKVFANGNERKAVLESAKLIEEYDAFLLVEASEATARELARRFPVEDISDQYALQFGDRTIKTTTRRASPLGKSAASKAGAKLPSGPHH
jgi:serine protease AprX